MEIHAYRATASAFTLYDDESVGGGATIDPR